MRTVTVARGTCRAVVVALLAAAAWACAEEDSPRWVTPSSFAPEDARGSGHSDAGPPAPDARRPAPDPGGPAADSSAPAADAGALPGAEHIGEDCETAADCGGGECFETDDGGVCGSLCSGPGCDLLCAAVCPSGFLCSAKEAGAVACVPAFGVLCRPCKSDSDCTTPERTWPGSECVGYGSAGSFCGAACGQGVKAGCPTGFACQNDGEGDQCVAVSGLCACSPGAEGASTTCSATNGHGTCEGARYCLGGVLTPCDAPAAEPEVCGDGKDQDCNGLLDDGCDPEDSDSDGVPDSVDCAPHDGTRFQGNTETCNGVDDDCDGAADPESAAGCTTYYEDGDGDGAGTAATKCLCAPAAPWTASGGGDCNDGNAAIGPGAKETCDGTDNDCDGATDEGCTPAGVKTCYPGADDSYSVCFSLVPKSSFSDPAYVYPAPSGSPNPAQYAVPTYFLDLSTAAPDTKLAKNFQLKEVMQEAKGKWAVFGPKATSRLQAVRSKLGVPLYVTSGYRSPGYNAGLEGAATYSRHMYGDAVDLTTQGATTLQAIIDACTANSADYTQLYEAHVHCDWRNDPLDAGYWHATGAGKPGGPPPPEPTAEVPPPAELPAPFAVLLLQARWSGFDEGTPWVRWEVTGPQTELVVEPSPRLSFVPEHRGEYRVRWQVGARARGELVLPVW